MNIKYIAIIFIIAIFVIGALLRSVEIVSGNFVFGFDQGLYHQDVKAFIDSKKPPLIGTYTPLPGIFQHPIFYWLLALAMIGFNVNPYVSMVLMFLISVTAVILVFLFSRKMYGTFTGIIITLFFSLSYPVSHGARILWPPLPIFLVMPIYLFLVHQLLKGKYYYFPFIFLSLGIITAFEIAAGVLLFIPTFILLFFLARKSFTVKNLVLSVLFNIILFSPLLLFNFRHENIILNGVFAFLRGESSAGDIMSFGTRIFSHFYSLIDNFKFSFTSNEAWKILFPLSIFMLIAYLMKYKTKDKFVIFLILLPLITYFELMIFKTYVWPWYLIPFTVSNIFLIGIISSKFLMSKNYLMIFIVIIFISIFTLDSFQRLNHAFRIEIDDYGGTAKIKGKTDAIDYIYKDSKGVKFNLLVYSPPVYTYPYDYILEGYAKEKYGFTPGKNKKDDLYLLMEPDPYKPSSHMGWLETIVKDGEVVKTIKLPSGFIVQKRLIKE